MKFGSGQNVAASKEAYAPARPVDAFRPNEIGREPLMESEDGKVPMKEAVKRAVMAKLRIK